MRLIVVSNRLPLTMEVHPDGTRTFRMSSGGLVAALSGVREKFKGQMLWLGWIGHDVKMEDRPEVCKLLLEHNCIPVFIDEDIMDDHYNGFSNGVIWPLFHYLPGEGQWHPNWWNAYNVANKAFADAVADCYEEGDLVWVHDYHLMLMPRMLRTMNPSVHIGFFLHIPFPSSEIYRILQVRNEVLEGLCHCDLIGFHTYDYARHFKKACTYVLGLETDPGGLDFRGRYVNVGVFPVGIDPSKFEATLAKPSVIERIGQLREQFADRKILIGVDRLDYIKGVPHKLRAMEVFLQQHPEWQGKVTLVQIAVPSRTDVEEYQKLKAEVDELVGRINGQYGLDGSETIKYMFTSVAFEELCALYSLADCLVVSSVRDGMNLVSQEYLMCQKDGCGTLVLSEFAGAAQSLSGSILVNPWDFQEMADAIHQALTMPMAERKERHNKLYEYIKTHTAQTWGEDFVDSLKTSSEEHARVHQTPKLDLPQLQSDYQGSSNRILIFDCDGTLLPPVSLPEGLVTRPSTKILEALRKLSDDPKNTVFILSGRTKETMDEWFEGVNCGMMAEYGFFYRLPKSEDVDNTWHQLLLEPDLSWIDTIAPVLEYFSERTPNAIFERKEASLTWNFRHAYVPFGTYQARELQLHLDNVFGKLPIDVVYSSKEKAVHVRPRHCNLEAAVKTILSVPDDAVSDDCSQEAMTDNERMILYRSLVNKSKRKADFLLYMGTLLNEYDFGAMVTSKEKVYTCTTGRKGAARFYLDKLGDVQECIFSLDSALA